LKIPTLASAAWFDWTHFHTLFVIELYQATFHAQAAAQEMEFRALSSVDSECFLPGKWMADPHAGATLFN
jgi:hypothetical protein